MARKDKGANDEPNEPLVSKGTAGEEELAESVEGDVRT